MRTKTLFCIFLFGLGLGQVYCQHQLKIGVNAESPPFFFLVKGENAYGQYDTAGLEYELALRLAKYIAKSTNTKYYYPEFVILESPEAREKKLPELDFVINRFSVTKERKKTIQFSDPYYTSSTRLAKLFHKDKTITRIGFMRGSTSEDYLTKQRDNKQLPEGLTLISIPNQTLLLQQFFKGDLDAIVDDKEFIKYWNVHTNDFTSYVEVQNNEADTFAIAVSNASYHEIVNNFIKSISAIDPNSGKKIWETLLIAGKSKAPIPGIIKYPTRKRYDFIIPIFLGVPIVVTIGLILLGNYTGKKDSQNYEFELSENEPVNFAWIIANSKYEFKKGLSNHPYNDAIKLKQALNKHSFPNSHIAVQKDATRKGILKTFQDIASRNQNADVPFSEVIQPKDNLLIYFSGHGEQIQIGQQQVGFWVPIDGASFWEFVPDYEIKAMLSVMDVKRILLISDSCFSAALLNSKHDDTNQSVEIITAGNNRVPAESIFLEKLADLLSAHSMDTLSASEIYNHLKSELTNHRYYQPQFASNAKEVNENFTFKKSSVVVKSTQEEVPIAEKMMDVLRQFSPKQRTIGYAEVRASSRLDEKSFSQTISLLADKRLINLRSNNSIFITENGLNYGK